MGSAPAEAGSPMLGCIRISRLAVGLARRVHTPNGATVGRNPSAPATPAASAA